MFKVNKKKILSVIVVLAMLNLTMLVGCEKRERSMILATTTSTQDSGLLDYLLPEFKKDTGIDVKVLAKGTGEALEVAKKGDADALLVHAKEQELKFISDGFGTERIEVMYNDFVLVGPKNDPAKVKEKSSDILKSFEIIKEGNFKFVSRGDNSGTNTKENNIWKSAGIEPKWEGYISAGKGMGEVLQMASEMGAYTLTDRATFLSMQDELDLNIVTEKNSELLNQYALIKLKPINDEIKVQESDEFTKWMCSEKGQELIENFGKDKYGSSLFISNAKK